jgi:hypothetical protein
MSYVRRPNPDPERQAAVVQAFVDLYGRLEPLLGDRWPDRSVRSVCSRNDAVTSIMQDDGTWLCSGCHRPGRSSSRK